MVLIIVLMVVGLVLLIKGADWFVDGASALAKKFNVSELAIGLTIVAFGTSAPELVVNAMAASQGHSDIVFGNIIGSNNFNLFIILGISGLITPMVVQSSTAWREIPFSIIAILVLFFLANDHITHQGVPFLGRWDGLILAVFFILFLWYVYKQLKTDPTAEKTNATSMTGLKITLFIVLGLAGLVIGGRLVVDNAVKLAVILNMSQKVIGLTIVAAGTSLPELATSIVAARKKNNDIAVGNIIGSNIFNIFLILAVSAFINPLSFNPTFNTDLYVLGAGSIFLMAAMYTGTFRKLDRWEAGVLLAFYIGYTIWMIQNV